MNAATLPQPPSLEADTRRLAQALNALAGEPCSSRVVRRSLPGWSRRRYARAYVALIAHLEVSQ